MIRLGFRMKLNPSMAMEYRTRHNQIAPELLALFRKAGISDYTIFLDPDTGDLFGMRNVVDDFNPADISSDPIMREWWNSLTGILVVGEDSRPISVPLIEVFHMD